MDRVLTEAIGTFFLMFVVIGTLSQGTPLAALAVGGILAVIVYAGARISGAHYNPAVSVAAVLQGRLPLADLPTYVGAQLAGASAASLLASWTFRIGHSPGTAWSGRMLATAIVVEAVFTFLLVFVFFTVVPDDGLPTNAHYGVAVGSVVAVAIVAVGMLSGAALNPAVATGVTFSQLSAWGNLWAYVVAQLVGGILGALAFRALNPDNTPSAA